jgi:hypothetical protein
MLEIRPLDIRAPGTRLFQSQGLSSHGFSAPEAAKQKAAALNIPVSCPATAAAATREWCARPIGEPKS